MSAAAATAPSAVTSAPACPSSLPTIAVLLCSKDRAFQLHECLRSMLKPHEAVHSDASGASAPLSSDHASLSASPSTPFPSSAACPCRPQARLVVTVLYTCSSPAHAESYDRVRSLWPDSTVHFQREEEVWQAPKWAAEGVPTDAGPEPISKPILDTSQPASASASSWSSSPPSSSSSAYADHCIRFLWHCSSLIDASGTPLIDAVLLLVDDVLFVRCSCEVPWAASVRALRSDPALLSVQMSLHPRVDYCHPASRAAHPPMLFSSDEAGGGQITATEAFEQAGSSDEDGRHPVRLLKFLRVLGTLDWNYPLSLCGGLYRLADLTALLRTMEHTCADREAFSHPNRFELVANRVAAMGVKGGTAPGGLAKAQVDIAAGAGLSASTLSVAAAAVSREVPLAARCGFSACPSSAVLAVVTVNRVQSIFRNPVYTAAKSVSAAVSAAASPSADSATSRVETEVSGPASSPEDQGPTPNGLAPSPPDELSADELLRLLSASDFRLELDVPRYRAIRDSFRSVHIGEFFTKMTPTRL